MAHRITKTILDISIGALIGSTIGFLYAKKMYDKRDNEEIERIKEMYRKKYETADKKEEIVEEKKPEEAYEKIACEYHTSETSKPKKNFNIKIIRPDEFGVDFSYDTYTLIYYADNVLAYDDTDEIVPNIETTVGVENLNQVKSYNDDALYIKNDILKTYFEILPSDKTYAEMTGYSDNY